jgi:shingomyelin synthase
MVTTTVSLIITNENVPEDPSLPDLVLDQVTYWGAGVIVSESLMAVAMIIAFTTIALHRHRSIILRRVFFLVGLMYYYRALTMCITVLPKPDQYWACPKQNSSLTMSDVWSKLTRVAGDGGISLGDKQQFCGDYIFSGHTMVLIMAYLIVKEYSPEEFSLLHWFSYCLFLSGVSSLLLGRGHYSIDVLLGYWVTTRTWAMYHTMANTSSLKVRSKHNTLQTLWWWRVFILLEGEVPGPVPQEYGLPVPGWLERRAGRVGRLLGWERGSA